MQTVNCPRSILPNGYLNVGNESNFTDIIQFTSTGLNTNGVFFVPKSGTLYQEMKDLMTSYQTGQATRVSNTIYLLFEQFTSISNESCDIKTTQSIQKVTPSKTPVCTVYTEFLTNST